MFKKYGIISLSILLVCTTVFAQQKYVGWSTGYRTTWGGPAYNSINFKCYTHLCYFNGSINGVGATEGKKFSDACHANNTKSIVCIGGWGTMKAFESACATASSRKTFIDKIVKVMRDGGFDGIDIDWEDEGGGIKSTYTDLMKELRAAVDVYTPRPIITVATAAYQSSSCPPIAEYVDQMNLMSYWVLVNGIPNQIKSFTDKGIAKTKLGVGWGYDTDGEVDVDNPTDIRAKCEWAINNGCGGVMIWEIGRACTECMTVNASFVNKSATALEYNVVMQQRTNQNLFSVVNNSTSGSEVLFTLPSAQFVDMKLYNTRGMQILSLYHGTQDAGKYRVVLNNRETGHAVQPGVYVLKMATPASKQAGTVVVK